MTRRGGIRGHARLGQRRLGRASRGRVEVALERHLAGWGREEEIAVGAHSGSRTYAARLGLRTEARR